MPVVIGTPQASRVLRWTMGGESVSVTTSPYCPVTEERFRLRVSSAARQAEDASELLSLLSPAAAAAIASVEPEVMEAASVIWLAAMLGAEVATEWSGICGPDGAPLDLTPEHWQLACFTAPGFARGFWAAWLEPRMAEVAAGNA